MYNIGKEYKIEVEINGKYLFYTCKIVAEDEHFISIETSHKEHLIFNKKKIIQAMKLENEKRK